MKKLLTLIILTFCFSVAQAQTDLSSLERNIKHSAQANQMSSILALIIEVEKPTPYQRAEMIKLENQLYQEAAQQKFSNFAQLAKFLNERMPESTEDTILIKDAFPVSSDRPANGYLDCDGRTMYALGVLERLGHPFKVYAVSQIDHMLLTDGKLFYDLLYSQYARAPKKDEWSYTLPLMTRNDIHGHLLGNVALFLWKGGGEYSYPDQEPYIMQGFEVAEQAYQKNPKNVSLVFNWYKFLRETKDNYTFPQLINALGVLLGRAEREGLRYTPVKVPEDFYLDTNPKSKIIAKKIENTFLKNKWIRYALPRIADLYGLKAEKFILEVYLAAAPDDYGQNQRTYACVLHALGHSHEEVLTLRNQANEKFENFIQNNDITKFPVETRFSLSMIYKHQVKVTDLEFLDYCHKNFF